METEESHQYSGKTTVQQKCCLIFIIFPFAFRQLTFKHCVKHPRGSYSRLSMLKVNRSMSTLKHTHFQAISVTPAHTGNLPRASTGFYSRFSMQKKRCTFCTVPCQPWGKLHTCKNTKASRPTVQCFTVHSDVLNDHVQRTHRQAWFLSRLSATYTPWKHCVLKVSTLVVHS